MSLMPTFFAPSAGSVVAPIYDESFTTPISQISTGAKSYVTGKWYDVYFHGVTGAGVSAVELFVNGTTTGYSRTYMVSQAIDGANDSFSNGIDILTGTHLDMNAKVMYDGTWVHMNAVFSRLGGATGKRFIHSVARVASGSFTTIEMISNSATGLASGKLLVQEIG